ncbi:MAG: tRNA lysidine(34) synthetase TilS [Planctomycetota bacterium]|nr:tRNA lysidine(34) synthetase TilS [Planctomycetota bacterium]
MGTEVVGVIAREKIAVTRRESQRTMPETGNSQESSFKFQLARNLKRLVGTRQGFLLAVSGGRDSMALLYGVHAIRGAHDRSAIVVAHLNHGLRGDSGRCDAELVRDACKSLDIPVVISECEAGQLERSSRGSLEEAARTMRYEFLQSAAAQHALPLIVTAHHASDQAETVLHNILRGTGLRGLRGIPERRRLSESAEIIRPMLTILDSTIAAYIQQGEFAFATDTTNNDSKFTRNRIRNQLLPQLQSEFNRQTPDALIRLAEQTRELVQSLDIIAETLLTEAVLEQTPICCRLDVRQMRQQPEPIVRHALTVLWRQQDWPRRDMNRDHWKHLSAVLFGSSSPIDLPGRVRAELRGNLLALEQRDRH